MQDWSQGYVQQVDYTYGFYRSLTPAHMSFVRQTQIQEGPDLSALKTYCELGCGQGFGTNLLAAANPHMDFYANDFNPAQIAKAQKLARQAHLPNMHFYEDSFESFIDNPDLPDRFDIIALHGVYSWISEEARAHIRAFLAKKLKPSGMVYISYNCQAGWAPLLPLRELLRSFAPNDPSPLEITSALNQVQQVLQSNPAYLRQVPGAKDFFERLQGRDIRYLAHELFNQDFQPLPFSQIERDLKEAKASFIGSMKVFDHYDDLNFSHDQCHLLSDSPSQATRQDLRDFLASSQFRQDLFIKGASEQSSYDIRKGWLNQWLAMVWPDDIPLSEVKTGKGRLTLDRKIYQKILACFSGGPCQVVDIVASLEADETAPSYKWSLLTKALTLLVGANILQPCLPVAGLEARKKRTDRLNHLICQQAIASNDLQYLASPVLGSARSVDRYDMIFMLAEAKGEQDPAHWAYQQLEWGESTYIGAEPGQTPQSPKLERLRDLYARYDKSGRAYYQRLGMTPDAPSDQGLAVKTSGNEDGSDALPSQEAFARFSSN